MGDKPITVEKIGIEHVPDEQRHGSTGRVFTLWFAANLTVADYVIGVLTTVAFGFSVGQAIPILLLGNLLGGLFLGLAAAMGPSLGFPQMFASRASFGRRGNYIPGALNWVSTVGWFTVNTILAAEAIRVLVPAASFALAAVILVLFQVVIAVYGHDFIHLFEKAMSVILALLFLYIFVLVVYSPNAPSLYPTAAPVYVIGSAATLFVVAFSYLMSWSPYASDYTRYLPASTSRKRVLLFALVGGGASSFAVEVIGALVGSATGSLDYFGSLYAFAGASGPLAILAIILGATAANTLNLYTNALSALVLDVRAKRWATVLAGGLVGLAVTIISGASFESFYENFLLALAYWITPWLGIVLVDFYVAKTATVESTRNAPSWDWMAIAIYGFSVLVSVPFMVPLLAIGYPVGALSSLFGGADFSYFVSFGAAVVLTFASRKRRPAIKMPASAAS